MEGTAQELSAAGVLVGLPQPASIKKALFPSFLCVCVRTDVRVHIFVLHTNPHPHSAFLVEASLMNVFIRTIGQMTVTSHGALFWFFTFTQIPLPSTLFPPAACSCFERKSSAKPPYVTHPPPNSRQ